jgi:hypothetical protein
MKVFYLSKIKQLNFSALIIILIGFTSCGTYQSAYSDDDGIYTTRDRNVSSDTNSNQDDNYFAQKLEEYQNIDNGDLITDVDGYSYQDQNGVYESNDSNYENSPWGYSNDVTISVYSSGVFGSYGNHQFLNNYWFTGNNYNYPYRNSWRPGDYRYHYYGSNNWGFNNWGFNNYWNNGFYGYNNFYNGFYCPPYYSSFYGSNNYAYNNSYGRRTTYNSRNNTSKRRVITGTDRRNSIISNRHSTTKRNIYYSTPQIRRVSENLQRSTSRQVQDTNKTNTNRSRTNTNRSTTRRSTPIRSTNRTYSNNTPSRTRSNSSSTRSTRTRSSSSSTRSTSTSKSTRRNN